MAIKEQDKVFYEKLANGDKVINLPVTRANNVEGLGRSANTYYSVGNVVYADSNLSVALKCITAGTTSNTELNVSGNSIGDSVTDGSVVWEVVSRDVAIEMLKNIAKGIDIPTLTLAGNRTIADLRTALEEWLNSNSFSCGAVKFGATPYFIEAWNNEDLTYSIPDASWWNVYSIGSYSRADYTHLLLVSYDAKNIYTLQRQRNVWGKIQKLATNGSMPISSYINLSKDLRSYTAPCDGWLYGDFKNDGSGKLQGGLHNGSGLWLYFTATSGVYSYSGVIPLAKGQTATIDVTIGSLVNLRFAYAQSEV